MEASKRDGRAVVGAPGGVCQVAGCGERATASVRFASGVHRYCARCADAARRQVLQPSLVVPDWFVEDELGDQAAAAGQALGVRCRACGARTEQAGGALPDRCPDCGHDGHA